MQFQSHQLAIPPIEGIDWGKIVLTSIPTVWELVKDVTDPDPEQVARRKQKREARERRRQLRRARKADKRFRKEIEDAREEYLELFKDGEIDLPTYERWIEELKDGTVWHRANPEA